MNLTIHPDGFILGGACHKRLHDRANREIGAWMAWNDLVIQGCVINSNYWLRVIKNIKEKFIRNGSQNIGYCRAYQEIFSQLLKSKRFFRMTWMEKWLHDVARLEFGVHSPTPLGPFKFRLIASKPKDDELYDKGHADSYLKEKVRQLKCL